MNPTIIRVLSSRSPAVALQKVAESLIGLRRDMSDKYSTAEPALFRMAVKNFDRANASENDQVPPLFGAVPAIKAAATFLKEELNLNSSEVRPVKPPFFLVILLLT